MGCCFFLSGHRYLRVMLCLLLSVAGLRAATITFSFHGLEIELSYDHKSLPKTKIALEETFLLEEWRWTEQHLCQQLLSDLVW